MSKQNVDKITELTLDWLDANRRKNDANNEERRIATKLQKEVASGHKEVDIDDKTMVLVGFLDSETEEIDCKEFFKKYPDKFWELVSIPKGAAVEAIGEKEVAKLSRTVTKNSFKVKKVKKD